MQIRKPLQSTAHVGNRARRTRQHSRRHIRAMMFTFLPFTNSSK
jgi:hypothetical protein